MVLIVAVSYGPDVDEPSCDRVFEDILSQKALALNVEYEADLSEGAVIAPFEGSVIICISEGVLDMPLRTSEENRSLDTERSANECGSVDRLVEPVDSTDRATSKKLLLGTDMLKDAALEIPL